MQRRRRTERKHTRTGGGLATRVMLFFSAVIILAGIANRFTGGDELTATVLATPSPTPLTAAFDETVEIREITLPAEVWYCLQSGIFSSEAAARERALHTATGVRPALSLPRAANSAYCSALMPPARTRRASRKSSPVSNPWKPTFMKWCAPRCICS